MTRESWKDIKKYEGLYQISNLGRVKSLERFANGKGGRKRLVKERILKTKVHGHGYEAVAISKDGKKTTFSVHRLVAIAFIPNPEFKETVNHIDGVKTNNVLANLEWATHKENSRHAVSTGLKPASNPNKNGRVQGEKNTSAKLNDEKVLFIRENSRRNGGSLSVRELSNMFGVCTAVISAVSSFKIWKHVGGRNEMDKNYNLSQTGYKNVHISGKKFRGYFTLAGKLHKCGTFSTPLEAHEAVVAKKEELTLSADRTT